jgi:hypothetical protein
LVPLDSSYIATPDGSGSFSFSISCRIFDFSGLGASSFCCARILAQRATAADFVAPHGETIPELHKASDYRRQTEMLKQKLLELFSTIICRS